MKNIIQFMVTKEQGVYTADGVNVPVVTEGSTFEELIGYWPVSIPSGLVSFC
jgi:hypothetical protein